MQAEATTASPLASGADTVVVGVFEDEEVAHDLPGNPLTALFASGEARRDFKRLAVTHADGRRFILIGLGPRARFGAERARVAAAVACGRAREMSTETLCWELPHHVGDDVVTGLVEGTLLHAYRFGRYKPSDDPHPPGRLVVSAHHDVSEAVRRSSIVAGAQNRARDLGNTPANDLTPTALAAYAKELADRHRLRAEILGEDEIKAAGMGAFAAVAQGSREEARLIRIDYDGPAGSGAPRIALVGKAVTFDSGGLSLKSAGSMEEMKFDMCGGAAVIEAVGVFAELQLPLRVVAIVGATENLPGGASLKPGDIVRALDGTTVEVDNTDAEGRLVLADCFCYARRAGCDRILDLATLTGGIVTALGSTYAGLMSNDDEWAEQLRRCGETSGDLLWRMPLHDEYAELVKGRYATLTNRPTRREASAVAGAEFLHHFTGDLPWAHIDIAGTAYNVRRPYLDKGATGYGVRLLVELAHRLGGAES